MKAYKRISGLLIVLLLIIGLTKLQTNKEDKAFYIEEFSSLIERASNAVDSVSDSEGDYAEIRLETHVMAEKFQDIYHFLYYTDNYIHKGNNLQYNTFAKLKTNVKNMIIDHQLDQEERRLLTELNKDLNVLKSSINSGYVTYDEVDEYLNEFRYKWDDESLFPSYKPTYLNDDEVMVLYDKAMDLYSIFDMGYLPVDVNQQFQVKDQTYYKVNRVFSSYDELVEALDDTYQNRVVDSLLERNIYINVNGDLYGRIGDRGSNIYLGEETYEVIRESDYKTVIKVTVEKLNDNNQVIDYETYDYILRFYSNGKWLFEDLYMFK